MINQINYISKQAFKIRKKINLEVKMFMKTKIK